MCDCEFFLVSFSRETPYFVLATTNAYRKSRISQVYTYCTVSYTYCTVSYTYCTVSPWHTAGSMVCMCM